MRGYGFFSQPGGDVPYSAGQVIFEEGQLGEELFVLLEGEVVITIEGAPIDRLEAGSIFGEMALVDDQPRSATAAAAVDSRLLVVNEARFVELLRDHPDFGVKVMSIMSARLRRLMEEEVIRQRMEEELRIGRRIQLSLLPDSCPTLAGWEFTATYSAAREVGGDFYDFVYEPDEPHRVNLVVADVTGKGVPAALFMASCRMAIRAETLAGRGPAEILQRANRLISLDTQSPLFLGAVFAALDAHSGRMVFANGGFERPLWLHGETGQVEELVAKGMLLGAFQEVYLEEPEIEIAAGDFLVFFSDGVTEARNTAGQFFGDDGLLNVLSSQQWQSAQRLLQGIVDAVNEFVGDHPPADDLTLIVIKRDS
jgi:serine phosphatase RsbU (regulator of sigma subunit)